MSGMQSRVRAAFAMLVPPIAWALHLCVCYFIVTIGCETEWMGAGRAVAGATVVLGAITGWAGIVAWQNRSTARPGDEISANVQFMHGVGLAAAPVFLIAIVLAGVVPAFVSRCA
jgi:hypothetical protein